MAKPAPCKVDNQIPSACAKCATFLAPAAAAAGATWLLCKRTQMSMLWKAPLGGFAGLAAICASAHRAALWQLKALPSEEELKASGGQRFVRPSDGQPMEYWLSGPEDARTFVVFCHRMDGRLGSQYGKDKMDKFLQSKGARLLSPSVPSLSASPPYQTNDPKQWLHQWSQDMLHLLDQLGARKVYVVGLSWGAQLALNLGVACQNRGLLRGIGQIGGYYWDSKEIVYPKNAEESGGEMVQWLFTREWVMRPLAYLLIRPFVPMMADMSKSFSKAEAEALEEHLGKPLSVFGEGMVRGMSYFLHQNWQVGVLSVNLEADAHVDLSKLDSCIPVIAFQGDEDRMVAEGMTQAFLAQVKHAKLHKFRGTHTGFPLHEILGTLMN